MTPKPCPPNKVIDISFQKKTPTKHLSMRHSYEQRRKYKVMIGGQNILLITVITSLFFINYFITLLGCYSSSLSLSTHNLAKAVLNTLYIIIIEFSQLHYVVLLSPFYWWGNWSLASFSCIKASQPVSHSTMLYIAMASVETVSMFLKHLSGFSFWHAKS